MAEQFICKIDGCDKPAKQRGWCWSHYKRWRSHGNPLSGGTSKGTLLVWLRGHVGHTGDECLIWPFACNESGYGVVRHAGRQQLASRVMCILAHGEPPVPRYHAAHSCGKGHEGCVHPGHLSWMSPAGNNADKLAHGTHFRGSRSPNAKITEHQAEQMRALHGSHSQSEIAAMFGISRTQVGRILRREGWDWS